MESIEKEYKTLFNKKLKKQKRTFIVLELIVTLIGYGLIIWFGSVWLAVGIWLTTWGNNLSISRHLNG